MKVLAKLRRGVIEITARDECLYADPTFLQRAYLLWTFRNFRRLSVRVLNDRQRWMVERLAGAAHSTEIKKINSELVIGRAEFAKLPVPKQLEWISVPQIRETPLLVSRKRRSLNLHELATLPRAMTERAAQALAYRPKLIRSYSQYSLVLTFALASLVIMSGAVAQRLWVGHAKQRVSTGAPLRQAASARADAAKEILHLRSVAAPMPVRDNTVTKPASPAALLLSPPAISANISNIKTVTLMAEPVGTDGTNSKSGETATSSRLRVYLAPRRVIYPSIPNSGFSANGNKQILVKALINAEGVVDDVQVPGEAPNLAATIAKTVRKWQYQPYLLNGQAVEVETRMIFTVLGPDAITVRFLPANENPAND